MGELTYKQVAEQTGLSHCTVEAYRKGLFAELCVKTKPGRAQLAVRLTLVKGS